MLVLLCDITWSQLVPLTSPWLQERKLKSQFQLTYKRPGRRMQAALCLTAGTCSKKQLSR